MRAVKLFAPRDMRLIEMEKPVPGPGEVLLQVKEVGVCASDVHWYQDGRIGDAIMTEPLILGHEFAGVIAGLGTGVDNITVGDRVAVEPAVHCGECDMCAEGAINLCRNILFCGTAPTDGAFREFMAWPANLVVSIPDSMTMGEAAMLEPLAVGVYAVQNAIENAGGIAGKTVGILGAGAIGLSILQAAKADGCGEAIVTDLFPYRLDLACKLGADRCFDANSAHIVDTVKEATGGRGLDVVFEAAGENDAVVQAMDIVRPGGLVVLGGIPDDDRILLKAGTVRRKGLTIRMLRRSKGTLEKSIRLVKEGKVDISSYITHRFPLEQVADAMEFAHNARDRAIRVAVEI